MINLQTLGATITEVITTSNRLAFDFVVAEIVEYKSYGRKGTDRYLLGYKCKDTGVVSFESRLQIYIDNNWHLPCFTISVARRNCVASTGLLDKLERCEAAPLEKYDYRLGNTLDRKIYDKNEAFYKEYAMFYYA
jgi:hypothetical protein